MPCIIRAKCLSTEEQRKENKLMCYMRSAGSHTVEVIPKFICDGRFTAGEIYLSLKSNSSKGRKVVDRM